MDNNIIQQVYDSFGVLPPEQRNTQEPSQADDKEAPTPYVPTDIYKNNQSVRREESRKTRPNGSSALVMAATQAVVDGDGAEGLAHAHKRAEDDSELYRKRGEHDRAEIAKRQYMEEHFLPAVETVISYTSPDELLNCKDALSKLDKYVFGSGNSTGYTAAYIRSAYGDLLGQDINHRFGESDPTVVEAVRRIKFLADSDDVRTAVGLAKQLKRQIDDGQHLAADDDYALIGRVAAYAS